MTTTFYSTAGDVIRRTGVGPEDLGMTDESDPDGALSSFIEDLLTEIADLFDRMMRKSYLEELTIPPGLAGIAADAASDSLRTMVATRQTPVVRIDDFAVRVIQARVLSPDIKERLKLYGKGRGAVSVDMGQDSISAVPPALGTTLTDGFDFDFGPA